MEPEINISATADSKDWRSWTNYVLFAIVIILISGAAFLNNRLVDTRFDNISKGITDLEKTIKERSDSQQTLLSQQGQKLDQVCHKLSEHDTLLRIPFDQRQKYYQSFKLGNER